MRDYATISKRLRRYSENCVAYKLDADFANAVTDAADAIEELLAAVPKWISVDERLPDDWKPVLAYDPIGYGEIGIAFIIGSLNTVVWRGVGFTNTAYPPGVTHWMPLPAPPKEVQDG